MYQGVQSHDRNVTFHNVQILAKAAKLFGIPTVISTVAKDSFSGPFMPEVTGLFPNLDIVDRTSINAWLDQGFHKAVRRTRGPTDASTDDGVLLGRPHQRHALERSTWRCRDRSWKSFA